MQSGQPLGLQVIGGEGRGVADVDSVGLASFGWSHGSLMDVATRPGTQGCALEPCVATELELKLLVCA